MTIEEITAERDSAISERDAARAEVERITAERDSAISERDAITAERDSAISERDAITAERDKIKKEYTEKFAKGPGGNPDVDQLDKEISDYFKKKL